MSSVIAAVAHDLDHPGVTQAFLVATSNHLVNLYHVINLVLKHFGVFFSVHVVIFQIVYK